MMDDYISRQAAIEKIHSEFDECLVWDESGKHTADEVERILDTIPPADVRPVVRGRWETTHRHNHNNHRLTGPDEFGVEHTITVREDIEYDWMRCPYCHATAADNFQNFCPNCGVDMTGGDAE